ncbi:iron-containing alcohol dehydrogenase family protein [Alteribacter natronophilus]|uniref:iron-containing alcohol dehydrogenase family protein n=1 Tax=Alteribacter natronophilus TaxID=2583810 RepID=UPI00110EC8A5|nr:iron-containing alcohol dehydrogenase [Alteribacter natronophilus]TMW72264.1 iron-containing alcohol dehydrogenase [Alteribacter natronophilus]
MRSTWKVNFTETVVFGNGAINELPELCDKFNAKNIVIVTDRGIRDAGILQKVVDTFDDSYQTFVYDRAIPEPPVDSAVECLEEAKNYMDVDLIVGLGGGSSIDLAKVVALLLRYGGEPADYFGEHKVPGPVAPLIAIPTTAGTGSEVTSVTVLTDVKNKMKTGISANELRPKVALLDPELTLKLPAYVTACSGIDALSHAVEAYTAKDAHYIETDDELLFQGGNPISDALALQAIKYIFEGLVLAVNQGSNIEARSKMLMGSLLAGQAFSNAGTAAAHALAYPLGGIVKSPHGELTGLLLPHVLRYNQSVIKDKLATVERFISPESGVLTEEEAGDRFIERVEQLLEEIQLPSSLSQIGVKEEDLAEVAEKALTIDRLVRNTPRVPTKESFEKLLLGAL